MSTSYTGDAGEIKRRMDIALRVMVLVCMGYTKLCLKSTNGEIVQGRFIETRTVTNDRVRFAVVICIQPTEDAEYPRYVDAGSIETIEGVLAPA